MAALLSTDSPTYLQRLAKVLNVHEHVYHRDMGRIIAGRWFVSHGTLMVHRVNESGNTLPVRDVTMLYNGHGEDIVASRKAGK